MWIYAEVEPVIKCIMLVFACFLALRFSPRRVNTFRVWKRSLRRLAHRPWVCAAVILGISVGLNILLWSCRPALPWIHDEYSYLLASDTFCNGRLTNPMHPLGEHFESFHILTEPSYMSKYPPANALFMAGGQKLFGEPIVGVWIALGLASVTTFWMLRAWTNPTWAFLGGVLVACNGSLLHAWGQSYWGGAVAFLGGALVFGGIRRILAEARLNDALLCGIGLLILANSRPLEGFLASIPVFALLAWWMVGNRVFTLGRKMSQVVLPMTLIGVVGITGMGIYNHAVTGNTLQMPYQLHDQTYSASSLLIWKPPPTPARYRHPRMERYFLEFGRARQLSLRSMSIYLTNLKNKFVLLWQFFPIAMEICFLALPVIWKDGWSRMALITIAGLLLLHSQLAASWVFPHYLAPVAALFFVLGIQCLRRLRLWGRQSGWGPALVRIVLVFAVLKIVPVFISYQKPTRLHPRQLVENKLLADQEPDLVIVSYSENYRVTDEWVYNAADIDAAPIVWARDMGMEKNARLLEYFAGRKVWRWHLENDESMILAHWKENQELGLSSNLSGKTKP